MGKTTLIIRGHRKNTKGKSSIFVRYCHGDRSCFFATGVLIDQKVWDGREETIRKSLPGYSSLNALLNKRKLEVSEVQIKLQLQDIEPTVDAVRKQYQMKYKPVEKEPESIKYLLDFWDDFVIYQLDIKRIAKGTLVQYNGTRKKIVAFEKYMSTRLTLTNLNKEFGEQFMYFEFKVGNCSNNTVGNRLKMIRSFNNYLIAKSLISDNTFKNVKKPSNKSDMVTLSIEEINQLMELDLTSSKKLERVRDLYCFNSNVGLRFSDLNGLTSANFKGDYVIVTTRKNHSYLRIPINTMAKKILLKYNYDLPKVSNVKFNKFIKEVGEVAKLDTDFEIHKFQAGERKKILVPLKKLLTSHQCRRNFCTNCIRLGMAPSMVQKLTGHADYRTFAKYLYVSDERIGEEFNKAWNDVTSK